MIIKDPIYGKQKIEEGILKELVSSKELLRLKKIAQFGVPDKYYWIKGFSRYEHSVGVMLLLRILGADLETQVAGLIHDVSQKAFSHVADWVFGSQVSEDGHDLGHEEFIAETRIPAILKNHGFDFKKVIEPLNYPALDRHIPHLCVDRVDFALREFKMWAAPKLVKECLESLLIHEDRLVFDNVATTEKFGKNYLKLQTEHWGSRQAVARYELFSRILKDGVKKGVVKPKDFYQTDDFIIKKLESNNEFREELKPLKKKKLPRTDGKKRIRKKFRYVDPEVLIGGKPARLSKIRPRFLKEIEKHRQINEKGILV